MLGIVAHVLGVLTLSAGLSLQAQAAPTLGTVPDAIRNISPLRTLSVPKPSVKPAAPGTAAPAKILNRPELDAHATADSPAQPNAVVGGAGAASSNVVAGGGNATGFDGINITRMEAAGTGKYTKVNGGLEPPDQALCTGNGYVVEGVNLAWQFYDRSGRALSPVVPLAQFYKVPLPTTIVAAGVGGDFLSDPKCYYDAATQRFFLTTLEIDTTATGVFGRAHNFVAVSKTSNPIGEYFLYSFDITDDGLNGTPLHLTCPCLGDQPLLGADANGLYMSTNEFSMAEVLPIQPPPVLNGPLNLIFTLPDFRNGQAQVYALPKLKMEHGGTIPMVSYDTAKIPLPGNPPRGATWSSLQPAFSPPGDETAATRTGAEYFLSSIDFDTHGAKRIAVWALLNTNALNSSNPKASQMPLQHVLVTPSSGGYQADGNPYSAVQKTGPHPLGDGCAPVGCVEETIAANDDRMNQVMLTNGILWSGLNTKLPAINPGGTGNDAHDRVGIQYYGAHPQIVGGNLQATMVRDGYLNVANENVLFPSVAAAPGGAVVMGFSLSGKDYFPSAGWARLDIAAGAQARWSTFRARALLLRTASPVTPSRASCPIP